MYSPHFTITPKLNTQIAQIERARIIIERSHILPTTEIVLRHRALVEATRSSTGIEGNPLNEKEVEQIFAGKRILKDIRFITEVRNYKKALIYVQNRMKSSLAMGVKDILRMHSLTMKGLLPPNRLGKWRKTPIYIVNRTKKREVVVYKGPKANQVGQLIDDLIKWIDQKSNNNHPLLVAGILHYELVSIHPFADGNGRVTRLMTLLYLYRKGYTFRNVLIPDTYYFNNRKAYYLALNRAKTYRKQRLADITGWLEYFIAGFLTVAQEVQEKVMLVSVVSPRASKVRLSNEDYEIVDFAQTMGKISLSDVIAIGALPRRTAQRRLKRLVNFGILVSKGKGPSTYYVLRKRRV